MVAALWPIARLRWPVLILNNAMLVATPIDGAHYLVDVLAGVVIAGGSLLAARALAMRAGRAPTSVIASKIPQVAVSD